MKKIIVALLILFVIKANAQTADGVVNNYARALGGLENFTKVKTMKMTGTVTTQGMDLPITIVIINGKAMRSDVEVMGQSITNSYKDGKGWKINPIQNITTPTDVSGTELNDFKTQSFVANQLIDYKSRGYKIELQGQEDVEGIKAYKIKLTTDDQRVYTYYISANDFMMIKSVNTRQMMGQSVDIETYYSNYKDIDGIKFSMKREQKANGQTFQTIQYEKIELNVPVDEKIFDKQ